jgi:hypothetical protein
VPFELGLLDSGSLVHVYATEADALAFMRDVIRIGGRSQAAGFVLDKRDEQGQLHRLAEGTALVRRALEQAEQA